MANKRKTYGVTGLMEWVCSIACGKAVLNVSFTGGTLTGYGVTPATYVTEDPVKQAILENSSYYKSGRIKLLREEPGTGKYKEHEIERRPEAGAHQGGQAATASAVLDSALNPDVGSSRRSFHEGGRGEDGEEAANDGGDGDTPGSGETAACGEEEGVPRVVEVTDIDDARDWLNEHLGVARRYMRSRAAVLQAAKNGGVELKGI